MPLVCINRITCVDFLQDLRDILHLVFLKKGDNDFPSRYIAWRRYPGLSFVLLKISKNLFLSLSSENILSLRLPLEVI